MYYEIVMPELQRLQELQFDSEGEQLPSENPEVAAGRLDLTATPPDGFGHRILDPGRPGYSVEHGQEVWSLCGKRFVPTSTSSVRSCPDCGRMKGSAERLREIEKTLRQHVRQLDFDHPLRSVQLFLVRGRVRRELGKSDEAAHDVFLAYEFLMRTTHISEDDRLALGEGIMLEAMALPDVSKKWLISFVEHLIMMTQPSNPERAYLLYWWSRLLEKQGRTREALSGYEQIVSSVDAGEFDASAIEMSRVFVDKEKAERKLGRSSDANASLRRAIGEAERRSDGGRLLVGCLLLSGVYLTEGNTRGEHEQARSDLQRAIDVARSQEAPDYGTLWMCLRQLADAQLTLGNRAGALAAAEEALKVVDDHLPDRSDRHEQTVRVIASLQETGSDEGS